MNWKSYRYKNVSIWFYKCVQARNFQIIFDIWVIVKIKRNRFFRYLDWCIVKGKKSRTGKNGYKIDDFSAHLESDIWFKNSIKIGSFNMFIVPKISWDILSFTFTYRMFILTVLYQQFQFFFCYNTFTDVIFTRSAISLV